MRAGMDEPNQQAQEDRVNSLWKKLDPNGEGQLDLEGLRRGFRRINHPLKNADDMLRALLKKIDSNSDGRIQYGEFSTFVKHAEIELWRLFHSINRDPDSNKMSKPDLRNAFFKAGIQVSNSKLDEFFSRVDSNHDGQVTFEEWREFLLFVPEDVPGLNAILPYFTATLRVGPEGDAQISDDTVNGLGTKLAFPLSLFSVIAALKQPPIRHRPPDTFQPSQFVPAMPVEHCWSRGMEKVSTSVDKCDDVEDIQQLSPLHSQTTWRAMLTTFLPKPGYFLAGGIAGIVSRTSTAPLDRLKVYLIARIDNTSEAMNAAKQGSPVKAVRHMAHPLINAAKDLWRAGGVRSLFAGNGLNVMKVMPESAIKFGSYEASKRLIASVQGIEDPQNLPPSSTFIAGGMGGIISQFFVYPIDTLKFRMQCEIVPDGLRGNQLIVATAKKMWTTSGIRSFYRGLPMGLVGMFPYSAIDLTTFESLKRWITKRNARKRGCHEEDAIPGSVATAFIGGFSGALGASLVYPINAMRTRLQTQGTAAHPRTYTGIVDVTRQTLKGEGVRGLFKGITPNLLKVVPAVSITYVVYENSKKILRLS